MSENLSVQRSFGTGYAGTISYVGSLGRHVLNFIYPNPRMAFANPGRDSQFARPYPLFTNQNFVADSGVSSYSGLQAKLEKHMSKEGLDFLAAYTWSHSLDNAPALLGSTGDAGIRNNGLVPIKYDYANSPWDTRQRFTLNGLYRLPWGVDRQFLNKPGVGNILAGGWSTSLTFVASAGNPFTVTPDITTANGGNARAFQVRNQFSPGGSPDPSNSGATCASSTKNKTHWYNPCAFANPLAGNLISPGPGGPGNNDPTQPQAGYTYPEYVTSLPLVLQFLGGRRSNALDAGFERINMSLFKSFPTFREQHVELRVDAFNLFNTPSYADPSTTSDNSNGGQITGPRFFQNFTPDARFFQFSGKYTF